MMRVPFLGILRSDGDGLVLLLLHFDCFGLFGLSHAAASDKGRTT